jgi:hypothetical protein
MTTLYRPSTGTEGEAFMEHFCFRCARDAAFQASGSGEDSCPIVAATFRLEVDDPDYPREWVREDDGSCRCTAFTLEGSKEERERFEARRDPRQASLPL